jgi:hypothetical protein
MSPTNNTIFLLAATTTTIITITFIKLRQYQLKQLKYEKQQSNKNITNNQDLILTTEYKHTTYYKRNNKQNNIFIPSSHFKFKHILLENIISNEELQIAFEQGVIPHFKETQLPSYSRYEDWRQSCYMEIHPKWTPQPEVNLAMLEKMAKIQEYCRLIFARWYCDLYSLDEVEITTLNSFITKYVAEPKKNEFGKHVDGIKVQGSLVLALPTDEENDWPGMMVWDGPKGRGIVNDDTRPKHHYMMQPGDALLLDRMVWHHGLPITKGKRYVVVNFYSCQWKKVSGTEGL